MAPIISPVLTFITFTGLALKHNDALNISRAFTSLSLLTLLYKPLSLIIGALPLLASAVACFTRIQAYMNKTVLRDNRIHRPVSVSSKDSLVLSTLPSAGNQIELLNTNKKDQDVVAAIRGRFQIEKDAKRILDITDCTVGRRTLTLLLGPVGCGKSTLLKALLGELSGFEGSINLASRGIAFCDQVPWLPNGTFREIVLGGSEFDQPWYESVIHACALEEDLRQWPQGDQSVIGSKGTILSGGQKQRTVSILDIGAEVMQTDRRIRFWHEQCIRDENSSYLMIY